MILTLPMIMAAVSPEILAVGNSYRDLRNIKGHWGGGEPDEDVDNYNGKKHLAMQQLAQYFGKPGTKLADIQSAMGEPDVTRKDLIEANQPSSVSFEYYVYQWRGNHDFVWFRIDNAKNIVLKSAWYFAYE
ncbi:hypothetical protein EMPS_08392 [Entomortierella parvispora]|uniref:Uncharacterized protein n=1 Tax=Entomortierella parvispora TaxID=205924 RepID=A0A9P3HG97_9FUNG|nr:hypothetical protein EMPS_08392 [Entomortierella parvispora]